MNSYILNSKEENKDKLKSGIITASIWTLLLLFIFMYKITEKIPEKKEVVTKILINFGDNRNGNGLEEPANQDGSLASNATPNTEEASAEIVSEPKIIEKPDITSAEKKDATKEKIITGNNAKISVKTPEKVEKKTKTATKSTPSASTTKTSGSKAATANSKSGQGDGKGTAAIGNLLKGKGTKTGTQGTNGTTGNAGDPLGGAGNGDSKIGIDRKLIGFIPGTMGRGGAQPSHSCSASGTINVSYVVDKAGNVISAKRLSGSSDGCISTNAVSWVKKYVKAEKSGTSSTGVYSITF